jgi:hypothetical protein
MNQLPLPKMSFSVFGTAPFYSDEQFVNLASFTNKYGKQFNELVASRLTAPAGASTAVAPVAASVTLRRGHFFVKLSSPMPVTISDRKHHLSKTLTITPQTPQKQRPSGKTVYPTPTRPPIPAPAQPPTPVAAKAKGGSK